MSRSPGRFRAEAALALVALIWGSTFVIVKGALADVSVFLFLAIRFTLGSALLALVLRRRLTGRLKLDWTGGAVCAGLLFLGFALQTAGLRLTTASKSAFLTGLYIVLVPLLGSLVHWNRPRPAELIGAALATAGTALLTSGNMDMRLTTGDLLTAGCAVAFAGHMLAVAHYGRRMDYELLSLVQVAGVAVLGWVGAGVLEQPRIVWSGRVLWAVGVTAVLATALSFVLYTWAQKQTSAARAALVFALEPVFAGLTAYVVSGEAWTGAMVGGAGLILGGIAVVEMKPSFGMGHQQD
jgi:drug/metabolite transporter (DMT)-like permease